MEWKSLGTPGVGDQTTVFLKCPSASSSHAHMEAPSSCKESVQRIMGPEVSISCTLRNPSFRRALWSGQFLKHFGLEWSFNMAAMIVFTPKYPSEGDICPVWNALLMSHGCVLGITCNKPIRVSYPISFKCQLHLHHWRIRYLHGGLKTSPERKRICSCVRLKHAQ